MRALFVLGACMLGAALGSGTTRAEASNPPTSQAGHAPAATTHTAPAKAPDWGHFYGHGYEPSLGKLSFFARAITPPGRPRRFDTRFFCVPAEAIAHKVPIQSGELSDLEWHSLASARSLELPNITRVILEDLGERIAANALHAPEVPVPFYHRRQGSFRRDLITAKGGLD